MQIGSTKNQDNLKKNQIKKEYFYSLRVAFNKELSLFQLVNNHS